MDRCTEGGSTGRFLLRRMGAASAWSVLCIAAALRLGSAEALAQPQNASSTDMARVQRCEALLDAGDVDKGLPCLRNYLAGLISAGKMREALTEYASWAGGFAQARQVSIAQELYEEGLLSKAASEPSLERAYLHFNYARFLERYGRLESAIIHIRWARRLFEQFTGPRSRETISANDTLGALLVNTGSVAIGMNIAERNFELARAALGDDEPLTWRTANNYAEALRSIGHPQAARPIDEFLLAKRVEHYGEGSIQALVSASNAALDCLALGDETCALRYFELQRRYGAALADPTSEHVPQAEAWVRYTKAYFAEDLSLPSDELEAMAALKDWRGSPDLLRVKAAALAAEQYEKKGDWERAIRLREEAHEIAVAAFRPTNPITSDAQLGLADAYARKGDDRKALEIFQAMDARLLEWMLREIGNAGNRFTAENTRAIADNFLFSFARFALAHEEARPAFAHAAGRWKAMESGERARLRLMVDHLPDDGTRALARDVIRLHGQRQEIMSSRRTLADREHDEAVIEALKAKAKELEERIAQLPPVTASSVPTTVEAVLGPSDALVNFIALSRRKPSLGSDDAVLERRLIAAVHRKAAAPVLVDLGDPDAFLDETPPATETEEGRSAALFRQLIGPLQVHIEGVERLYIVPDASLYAMPFSLLRDAEGRYLDQLYEVRFLTREDTLFQEGRSHRLAAGGKAVLAGGLDFSKGKEKGASPIPFSRREADRIDAILKGAGYRTTLLTGAAGTEAALRAEASGAEVIHLATHGFFHPIGDESNALWRSGLVLARSGSPADPRADGEDGYLYAQELLDWDLSSASLIVLSACETARGSASRIDAVRGLPTSLGIAGAQRFLLTLWAIDDEGAAAFMTRFYEHAAQPGTTYAEALRQARLDAIAGKVAKAEDPAVWGAFVMFEN
ncbi:CHAT domain-containing tetratricopeptide repeat protein [Nitratireductor sp. ZSWI3]|uniref:CHAT domain-containing protein n=1 Tax=Nitratireductor sp. ZSWI3 TaxID=2966359 RepID=UPI00214FEC96|nr:CHAT domain-containing tetratricopeptide repeat protein [Nitratireductor sp. ZSWI3]MCR4265412.1 CHAT domain-containing protein [Nitratireductor sp. ZSWI3]